MSHLYEDKIKNMGNAGRNGGEYYTVRPLIKAIVKVISPIIGQTVYDGTVGSMRFLGEGFLYLLNSKGGKEMLTTKDIETLQKNTFYGKEKKSLAYIIGVMNMIFHGIEAPNVIHTNTLAENLADIQEKDRYDIVLANPPNENDLAEFVELQKTYADSENSWSVNVKDINQSTFDLSVKNPNKKEEVTLRQPSSVN